jgi:hypothetical protein
MSFRSPLPRAKSSKKHQPAPKPKPGPSLTAKTQPKSPAKGCK